MFAPLPTIVPPFACETVTGRYVDVVNPKVEDIDFVDIAWSLARQVRYAGHTLGDPYHIAQHACFVEELVSKVLEKSNTLEDDLLKQSFNKWMLSTGCHWESLIDRKRVKIHALCHDNTEAYLVDLPTPVKRHPPLREPYKSLENNLKCVIEEALQIPPANRAEELIVTWADLMALQIEASNLMTSRGRGWSGMPDFDFRLMKIMPEILSWKEAHLAFVHKYNALRE